MGQFPRVVRFVPIQQYGTVRDSIAYGGTMRTDTTVLESVQDSSLWCITVYIIHTDTTVCGYCHNRFL